MDKSDLSEPYSDDDFFEESAPVGEDYEHLDSPETADTSFAIVAKSEDAQEEPVFDDQKDMPSHQVSALSSETGSEGNDSIVEFSPIDETSNLSSDSVEEGLKTSESLMNKTSMVESVNFADSDLEEEPGTFENLPIDISSKDIDAETYSIHGLAGETTKLNGKETTESNSFSYSKIDQENKSEAENSTVETSPLIPEWANQTENPAFFQNLDIPTFLRRRGSNRPRQ